MIKPPWSKNNTPKEYHSTILLRVRGLLYNVSFAVGVRATDRTTDRGACTADRKGVTCIFMPIILLSSSGRVVQMRSDGCRTSVCLLTSR